MPADKFDDEYIRHLAKVLEETGLSEIEIERDNIKIRVARNVTITASVPVAQPMAMPQGAPANTPAPVENLAAHPGAVKSPMVGMAYAAAEPGKPPFIKVGDRVNKGQTLLIVEAMKVMNPIPAPMGGTIKQILFNDAKPIEFDEVLVVIE